MDENPETVDLLKNKYEQILREEVDVVEDEDHNHIDYNFRIKEAVQSGKFRLSINVNHLRSNHQDMIQG